MCLAVPGKIIALENDDAIARSGRVSFGGVIKEVNLALVPNARVGDYVIVHAGFGISVLDEVQAQKTLDYVEEIKRLPESDGGER
jgi:hydrogenase expression/formation protein HypC